MTLEERNRANYIKMTETPVKSLIPKLAVPSIISMLISSIYNMADTFFVAKLGTSATGAVGVVFSIMGIIQAIGFTLGMGCGILASSALGAKDQKRAEMLVSTGFFSALGIGIIFMATGLIFNERLMVLLGATPTILPYAIDYARYIFIASPFMITSLVFNSVLRSEGKTSYAMLGITFGGILNIILDPIFIFVLDQGTAGAAMATAISQSVGFFILLIAFLSGKSSVRLRISQMARKSSVYFSILKIGLPSLSRQGLASLATALLNRSAGVYGDAAIAAMSIAGRVMYFLISSLFGLGQGYQPVAGFNWGAERYDRVKEATVFTATFGTIGCAVLSILCIILAPQIITIFRKDDPEVIRIGITALRAQALLLPVAGINVTTSMGLQGTQHVGKATFLAMCKQGIFFIPVILLFPKLFGLFGVQIAQPAADLFTFVCSLILYLSFLRELKEKHEQKLGGKISAGEL